MPIGLFLVLHREHEDVANEMCRSRDHDPTNPRILKQAFDPSFGCSNHM